MRDWTPDVGPASGPRYRAIVDTLAADITAGRIKPGTRLPPQRDMAERLGLSLGTISKAYAEAERRGLISGEVGRGTFVLRPRPRANGPDQPAMPANLALNVPPPTGEEQVIAATLAEIAADTDMSDLLGYAPHQGLRAHRDAMAEWLSAQGIAADPDRLAITSGAQHALSIALGLLAGRGDAVVTESLTYSGMMALASHTGCRLHGVDLDEAGAVPESLDRVLSSTGARVVYLMPTLQTPTGTVMPEARRGEIADVIRRNDACLIEDDVYAFLFPRPPRPISSLLPERGFYLMSFAKCLAPGLRVGAMIAPESFRDRVVNALRATGWMAAPAMVETAVRLIRGGGLGRQISLKREQAKLRYDLAHRILRGRVRATSPVGSFHVWLPLPAGRTLTALLTQAALAGITLAPPAALQPLDPASTGVRLCLGGVDSIMELDRVLATLRDMLAAAEAMSFV